MSDKIVGCLHLFNYHKSKYHYDNFLKVWLIVACMSIFIVGCESPSTDNPNHMVIASWDENSQTLSVSGMREASEESIQIYDATDGGLLGSAVVKEDGSWSASSTVSACDVHIDLTSGTKTVEVQNAPANCGSNRSGVSSRAVSKDEIPAGVLVVDNPQLLNTIPNAVILDPPQDITINVGEAVNFSATVTGGGVAPPFTYYWSFGGAAPNSGIQNPGSIRFFQPGTYFIQLTVTDNLGIPDPTPAVRTIVVGNTNSPVADTPTPTINSPVAFNGGVSISVGESLFFNGSATDSFGSNAFTYEWDFSGIYPNQFGATAGSIPFMQAGTYIVNLYATNPLGIRSVTPASITVLVGATGGVNQAPDGSITRPRNDVTIDVGESLNFRARASDPDNNIPLYYSWDLQGVAPDIIMSEERSTGRITFNNPGIYYIRMTTTDSLGAVDPNPPVRIVTVRNTVANPLPGGGNTVLFTQITSPPSDTTIEPGQSIFFSGQATGNGVSQYFWSFDGAAASSNLQTPGNITFPLPGQYIVMFFATDFSGNVVGTPATRTITVSDPSNITANIISPADNTTINAGGSVNLLGDVSNVSGFTNLRYEWKIKPRGSTNVIFSSNQINPGPYTFTQAGEFVVKFKVKGRDRFGNQTVAVKTKARVTVNNAVSFPPVGTPNQGVNTSGIMLPATDMVIFMGDQVDFEANRFSGTDINYSWDFNGLRRSSSRRNPTPLTFNNAGTFFITLQVSGTNNGIPFNVFDQRSITVLQQNPSFPPTNPGVQSTGIMLPVTDQVINVGESVDFEANRINGSNINYRWDFSGARSPSDSRNPRPVTFDQQGTYLITLQVSGTANGIPVNIFDQRVITVLQGAVGFPPTSPFPNNPVTQNAGISLPPTDEVIDVGQSVDFKANRFDGTNINYSWDFNGVRSPSSRRNPSPIQFNSAGTFLISLQVTGTDVLGIPFSVFDQRVVTVLQSGAGVPGNNPVQQGPAISLPITDQTINLGQSVNFEANRITGTNIVYSWNFDTVRSPSTRRRPGDVQFNSPGTFFVAVEITGTAPDGSPIYLFDIRVVNVLQSGVGTPPVGTPSPTVPVSFGSTIKAPSTDMVINIGDEVDFNANRISGTDINYNWDFSGVRSPTSRRNPSPVTFNSPGTFLVTLSVTGISNGLPINLFDQRVITVMQQNLPFPPVPTPPAQSPIGFTSGIKEPATDAVINIGESVDFEANRLTGTNVVYAWDFAGVRRPSDRRNPRPTQFDAAGSFLVSLKVTGTDATGLPINVYDHRMVTVLQPVSGFPPVTNPTPGNTPVTSPNNGPDGYITSPTSQLVSIRVGESIEFKGNGFDPLGNSQLSFQWSFGGATRNIVSQNPGFITFNRVGTFVVTLLVQNSLGQADTSPPSVLVQVSP